MTSLVSASIASHSIQHITFSSTPFKEAPTAENNISFPTETPLDKEIHNAIVNNIIDAACVLRSDLKIDREIVVCCLKECIKDELTSRKINKKIDLHRILLFAVNYNLAKLPIESVSFAGSSIVYKLADAIIKALEQSEARSLVTPLFIANLKRIPHDSDWKISIQYPPKNSPIVFWDEVEKYARAVIRGLALYKQGTILPPSFDLESECNKLGIDYEERPGDYIHLSFRECGIDLTLGHFEKEGLFLDTFPEIEIATKSLTGNLDDLKVELKDEKLSIIQAGVFRGCKILAVDNAANKNNRASVQLIRRTLTGDVSLSEIMYPTFIDTLFKDYPLGITWARKIAKKFCNINKGHSKTPAPRIIWSVFIFLCSLKRLPQYAVKIWNQHDVWEQIPSGMEWNESNNGLFFDNPIYQLIHKNKLACDVFEGILGIAGLLSSCFARDWSTGRFTLSRQHGINKTALWFIDEEISISIEPNLLTFCQSLKTYYADNPLNMGSNLSLELLKLFIEYSSLSEEAAPAESVMDRNRNRMPFPTYEIVELAHEFLAKQDTLLQVIGAAILVTLRGFDPNFIDETLLYEAFPALLSSTDENVKDFANLLAKKYLSSIAKKEAPSFLNPKTKVFSFAHWLNALTGTKHLRCCEIAAKYWASKVPPEKRNFQAYLSFMNNLWKAQPTTLVSVWEAIMINSFDIAQQKSIFCMFADKILAIPQDDSASSNERKNRELNCLGPFIHYVNTCVDNFAANEEGFRLHNLLLFISKERQALLPYCLHWLPLLPEDDIHLFNMGTTEELLQKKIVAVKTTEDKDALCVFIIKLIRLKGLYFTLVNPALSRIMEGTPHLAALYTAFIKQPSQCPLQKGRILLQALDKCPDQVLTLKDTITLQLTNLYDLKVLPFDLILKLLQKSYKTFSEYDSDFLLVFSCQLADRVLSKRLNNVVDVVELICKHRATLLADRKVLLVSLFSRLIHEYEAGAFSTALQLAYILKNLSILTTAAWESSIHKLKLAAFHHGKPEKLKVLLAFSRTLLGELRGICNQLELEILAQEFTPHSNDSLEQLKVLTSKRSELTEQQRVQLKAVAQRMIREKSKVNAVEASQWIDSPLIVELLCLEERIEVACLVLKCHFDSNLLTFVVNNLDKAKKLNKDIFDVFASDLIAGDHIFWNCESSEDRAKRLFNLEPYKNEKWYVIARPLLTNLIQEEKYELGLALFKKACPKESLTKELGEILKEVLIEIPHTQGYFFKAFVEIALDNTSSLDVQAWINIMSKIRSVKDKKVAEKCYKKWISEYPLPSKADLIEKSLEMNQAHYEALLLAKEFTISLDELFRTDFESIVLLLEVFAINPKSTQILAELFAYLLIQKPCLEYIPFIISTINNLSFHIECTRWTIPACCQLIEAALKEKSEELLRCTFAKLIECLDKSKEAEIVLLCKFNTELSSTTIKLIDNPLIDNLKNITAFILKLIPVLPVGDLAWLNILQWIVEHEKILITEHRDAFTRILFTILVPLPVNGSKKTKKAFTNFYQSTEFSTFILSIGNQVPLLKKQKEFKEFLYDCIVHKYLFDDIALQLHQQMMEEDFGRLDPPSFLDCYFKSILQVCNLSVADEDLMDKAIDMLFKLISAKEQTPQQHENKEISQHSLDKIQDLISTPKLNNFMVYSKRLLNNALYDPKSPADREFFCVNLKNFATTSSEFYFGHVVSSPPFNIARARKGIDLFLKKAFSDEVIISAHQYTEFIEVVALYIYAAIVLSTKLDPSERKPLRDTFLKFAFLPRPKNLADTSIFASLLKALVNSAYVNGLFDTEDQLTAIEAFAKFCIPTTTTFSHLDTGHIIYLSGQCLTLYPRGFLSFLELLSNLRFSGQPSKFWSVEFYRSLLKQICKRKLSEQYKMACGNIINYILDNAHLLRIGFKSFETNEKMSLIVFQKTYLLFLTKAYLEVNKSTPCENTAIIRDYLKKLEYSFDEKDIKFVFEVQKLDFIEQVLENLIGLFSQELNTEEELKQYIKIGDILLTFAALSNSLSEKFFGSFERYFFNSSILDSLKNLPEILRQKIVLLSLKALNIALASSKDSNKTILTIGSIICRNEYLKEPVNLYSHMDEKLFSLVPNVLHGTGNHSDATLTMEFFKARALANHINDSSYKKPIAYQLLHCCILAQSSMHPEQFYNNQILLELFRKIYLHYPEPPVILHVIGYLVEHCVLSSTDHSAQDIVIEALESLLNTKDFFKRLFKLCVAETWLGGEYLRQRKDQLIVEYLKLRNLSDTVSINPLTFTAYIRKQWSEGNFEHAYYYHLILKALLTPDEFIETLEFGIEKTTSRGYFSIGAMFALTLENMNPSADTIKVIGKAIRNFIFSLPNFQVEVSILFDLLNSGIVDRTITRDCQDLSCQFLIIIDAYREELSPEKIILLLDYYKKALLAELKRKPNLFHSKDVNHPSKLLKTLNVIISLKQIKQVELSIWLMDLLSGLKERLPFYDYYTLEFSFLRESALHSSFEGLNFVSELSILVCLQSLPNTPEMSLLVCAFYESFFNTARCTHADTKVFSIKIGIHIAKNAVEHQQFESANKVIRILNIRDDDPQLKAWSDEWMEDLIFLKNAFLAQELLSPALFCLAMLIGNVPGYSDTVERSKVYTMALSQKLYVKAVDIADQFNLWNNIDVDQLLTHLFANIKTEKKLLKTIWVLLKTGNRSPHYLKQILANIPAIPSKKFPVKFAESLALLEKVKPTAPESLRKDLWNKAIHLLYPTIDIFNFQSLLRYPLDKAVFKDDKEREIFFCHLLVITVRNSGCIQSNLGNLLDIRLSLSQRKDYLKMIDDALLGYLRHIISEKDYFLFVEFAIKILAGNEKMDLLNVRSLMSSLTQKINHFIVSLPFNNYKNKFLSFFNTLMLHNPSPATSLQYIYNVAEPIHPCLTRAAFHYFKQICTAPHIKASHKDIIGLCLMRFASKSYDINDEQTVTSDFEIILNNLLKCKIILRSFANEIRNILNLAKNTSRSVDLL